DPVTVQIGLIAPAKTVSHAFYPVPPTLKKKLLFAILQQTDTDRVLVFTRTKYRARGLARDLQKRRHRVAALQGNMSQNKRQEAITGFREGRYDILVATDIAARGIDVTEISHVINFDMPDTVDAYTHRIGRTGRAKQNGEAFTFAVDDDAAMIRDIEKVLATTIERRRLPEFDYGDFSPETWSPPSQGRSGQPRSSGSKRQRTGGKGRGQRSQNGVAHNPDHTRTNRTNEGNGASRRNRPNRRRRSAAPGKRF
ncbi:MAG: C-terminal helicase domain-containing protein, partial [Anaerolineae bacterium]|nr:C-terminal helicase domain-containing protein [Anaerolineae bacterium]